MFERLLHSALKSNKPETFFLIKDFWLDKNELNIVKFVRDYIIDNDEIPAVNIVEDKFDFDIATVSYGRLAYEMKAIRERYIAKSLSEKLPNIVTNLKHDPNQTLDSLRDLVNSLQSTDEVRDLPFHKDASARFLAYEALIGTNGVSYLSMGHSVLDDLFMGYGATDVITLAGRSGLGKTWFIILLALLAEACLPEDANPILFFTIEMNAEQIIRRMDAIRFKLDYELFRKGQLTKIAAARYKRGLMQLEKNPSKLVIIDDVTTLNDLQSKLLIYSPSIVFFDGSYMLEPQLEEDWKKIVKITRSFKMMAKKHRVPIFNTTQMKRGTGTKKSKSSFDAQDDFAWGSSFIQDSDVAITGYQTPEMVYNFEVAWQIAKGRDIVPGTELLWTNNLVTMDADFKLRENHAGVVSKLLMQGGDDNILKF